jgi:hypothetical protein
MIAGLFAVAVAAAATPAFAEEGSTHGAGTVELRLQSSSTVAGGGALLGLVQPGLTWAPDTGGTIVNLAAGGGYFLSSSFALGLDVGLLHVNPGDDADSSNMFTIAPFAKFVTGLPDHSAGFFAEVSPSFMILDVGNGANLLALTGWLGGHFFVARSAALLVGPYVTRLEDLDGGEGAFLLGLRFGLSVYLP